MSHAQSPRPGPPGLTASSLLDRARAHDPEAWRRLVELYGPLVYHWCRRRRLPREDIADVFQEVFRSVAAHLGEFRRDRPGATFRGWLFAFTRDKVRDHIRRGRDQAAAAGGSDALRELAQVADPCPEDDDPAEAGQQSALLHRALAMLRCEFEAPTWEAFWRATVNGHRPADTAHDLGVSVNAVYKARSRVLQRLREELGDLAE